MDVGAPSNFERMQAMYGGDITALRRDVVGSAYSDEQVVAEIRRVHARHGYILDPHSAIAWLALHDVLEHDRESSGVFIATAHPAKFREVVEPAIGENVQLPAVLADAVSRPRHSLSMAADYAQLAGFLRS